MLHIGQVYQAAITVRDLDDHPSAATLTIGKPDGTSETHNGPWTWTQAGRDWTTSYDYLLAALGIHQFAWVTQGPSTAPDPEYVNVRDYISILSTAEARLRLNEQSASDDTIRLFCAAATRLTEQKAGTVVVRTFTDDEIPGRFAWFLRLPHGPALGRDSVTSIRSVWPDGWSWTAADLIVSPAPGKVRRADGAPFHGGPWLATYKAGRVPVPENISAGCGQILWDLWGIMRGMTRDTDVPDITELPAIEAGYRLSVQAAELLGTELYAIPGFA